MRHLRDEKLLICEKPNELKARRKEPQVGDRIPVYRIKCGILRRRNHIQSVGHPWFLMGEIEWPRSRTSLAIRIWPKAGCSGQSKDQRLNLGRRAVG